MSHAISGEGIIIHQTRFGEADKFVKIMTHHHGLIDTVAKGVRKLTSKKSAHLDNLNLIKFQTNRGREPQYLSQVETLNNFSGIKKDLKKIRTCFYLTEIIHHTIPQNQTDEEMFCRLRDFLLAFDSAKEEETRELSVSFQKFLIAHLGFPPPSNWQPTTLVSYFESLIDRPLITREIKIS